MNPYIILSAIAGYLALFFVIAWLTGRRADNEGFFVGNRRSPWLVVAIGMIAAPMSGVTFVSVPGMVGTSGFAYLQMAMGFVVGYLVIAFVLVPSLYRRKIVSVYEYLDGRFGGSSYRTGAWFFFVSKMLGATVKIYLVCLVLQMIVWEPLGVPFAAGSAALMFLVWLYTFRGGVRSLVWTDALKTLFLFASVGLSIWFIAREMGLSLGDFSRTVGDSELSRVFFFDDVNDRRYFFKQFFSGLFIVIAMTGLDQDMMQLPLSCRSPRDSQKNFVLSGAMQFVAIFGFLCLGVLLHLFVEAREVAATGADLAGAAGASVGAAGASVGADLAGASTAVSAASSVVAPAGDGLFPFVAVSSGLPAVVGVVFALGLVASTWSAAGSALTSLTTSFTVDILGGGRLTGSANDAGGTGNKNGANSADNSQGEARLGRMRRLVHTAMAAAMVGVVLAFRALAHTSVIDAVYTLASYTYGPILGMFAFGLLTRRRVRDRWVPLVAVAAPALCLMLDLNSEAWFGGYRFGYELLIMNALFTFAGMAALGKQTTPQSVKAE